MKFPIYKAFLAALPFFLCASPRAAVIPFWDFEGSSLGFEGKVAFTQQGVSQGRRAMDIDARGSNGWNQNLAILGKQHLRDFSSAARFKLDAYVAQGTAQATGGLALIPVFSGPANRWYVLEARRLQDGMNRLEWEVDGKQIGRPWEFNLVLNSEGPMPAPFQVDNLRFESAGEDGKALVTVVDAKRRTLSGAIVACAGQRADTNAAGEALLELPAGDHEGEVLGPRLVPSTFKLRVTPKETTRIEVAAPQAQWEKQKSNVWVFPEEKIRTFEGPKLYGHNVALWNGPGLFHDQAAHRRMKEASVRMLRFPSGAWANRYDWRTGVVFAKDGRAEFRPEAGWPDFVALMREMGPKAEMMMIANVMQRDPKDTVDWIHAAKASGLRLRYVELGNEPDLQPEITRDGVKGWWTYPENFAKAYATFARAIRRAHPDVKLMGPCTTQYATRVCPGKAPWECDKSKDSPYWIEAFLKALAKEPDGDSLIDVLSFHSYPFWEGHGYKPDLIFETTKLHSQFLPRYRAWVEKYLPKAAETMEYAMTEYNLQVLENATTAKRIAAAWGANYLAEFASQGGDIANWWDLNTQKVTEGGGHGLLDGVGDPKNPYTPRATYWVMAMLAAHFNGRLLKTESSDESLAAYASEDRGKTTVLLINRSDKTLQRPLVQIKGLKAKAMIHQYLGADEYLWSEQLYRTVVNTGPATKTYRKPKHEKGWTLVRPSLEPLSVHLLVFE